MIINGREYCFKRPTLGLLMRAMEFARTARVFNENWYGALTERAEFDRIASEWREYCGMIFENADEGLALENLTPKEVVSIPQAFFISAVEENGGRASSKISDDLSRTPAAASPFLPATIPST